VFVIIYRIREKSQGHQAIMSYTGGVIVVVKRAQVAGKGANIARSHLSLLGHVLTGSAQHVLLFTLSSEYICRVMALSQWDWFGGH